MLKAVIFDFDGVVADSEALHCKAICATIAQFGIEVPKDKYYADYLGYTDLECFEAIGRDFNIEMSRQRLSQLIDEKFEIFEQLASKESMIIDGVTQFISMLEDAGVPLAICSGALAADIELMLADTDLRDKFCAMVTAEDVKKGKPDPEGYKMTLNMLNNKLKSPISAVDCLVIEDSHWGLQAARAAGMKTIAVTNTYTKDQLAGSAEVIVERLDELNMAQIAELCA